MDLHSVPGRHPTSESGVLGEGWIPVPESDPGGNHDTPKNVQWTSDRCEDFSEIRKEKKAEHTEWRERCKIDYPVVGRYAVLILQMMYGY